MRTFAVVLGLLLVPLAAAGGDGPTTSTGDVDTHGDPAGTICIPVFSAWTIRLTLLDPSPGDTVALVALFDEPPANAAVATHLTPQASVMGETGSTCKPPSVVAGLLVNGETPYKIEYLRGFAS